MKSNSALDLLHDGRFFLELEGQLWRGRPRDFMPGLVPWLGLIKTEAIQSWAEGSRAIRKVIEGRARPGENVLSRLLRRHLLHLDTRRDPTTLQRFWRWAAPCFSRICQIWDRLPGTLDYPLVPAQELAFGRVVEDAIRALSEGHTPSWILAPLREIVERRKNPARLPVARVVFAVSALPANEFRSGVLVDFRLVQRTERAHLQDEQVFDEAFRRALQYVRSRLLGTQLRVLEHDWGFLPPGQLMGTSGAMALWVAHSLAAPGQDFRRRPWAMPPWLVISANLDSDAATAGDAGEVGEISAKMQVLAEEGVRVLVVSGRAEPPTSRFQDLRICPLSGSASKIGKALLAKNYLMEADLSEIDSQLIAPADNQRTSARLRERNRARFFQFDEKADYLAPTYAFGAIRQGVARLSGKGYLHLTAPAGQGKSVLVKALAEGQNWEQVPPNLGKTLGYALMSGEPATPGAFLTNIINQAVRLDQYLTPPRIAEATDVPAVRRCLMALLSQLREAVCRADEPLILAIDGIDELPPDPTSNAGRPTPPTGLLPLLLDFLPPPDQLPANCYILLTSRPDIPSHIRSAIAHIRDGSSVGLFEEVALTNDDEAYRSLLEDYLIRGLGEEVRPLIPTILRTSQGQFLYVRLIRDWLVLLADRGHPLSGLSIDNLPEHGDIFPAYLEELEAAVNKEHGDPTHFSRWHRPLLLTIASALEGVDREILSFWLDELVTSRPDGDHVLDCTLEELRPLLKTDRQTWRDDRLLYSIGHSEQVDWFAKTTHPRWIGAMGEAIETIIAHGRSIFTPHVLESIEDWVTQAGIAFYHIRHMASHMIELGDIMNARDFLEASWQEPIYDASNNIMRSQERRGDMLDWAKDRQRQFTEVLNEAPVDDACSVDHFVGCLKGIAGAILAQVEAHERLGRSETALKLSTVLVELLDENDVVRFASVVKRRQYWRLLAEARIWQSRILLRQGHSSEATDTVQQAYAILHAMTTFIGPEGEKASDIEDDWIAWYVRATAEVNGYMICVQLQQGKLLACFLHNQEAIGGLDALIQGVVAPDEWLHPYLSLVEARLRAVSDRIVLLTRLADNGLTNEEQSMLESASASSSPLLTADELEDPFEAASRLCHTGIDEARAAIERASRDQGGRMQAMKWIPQLFTTDGRLLRNQSKLMEIAPEAIFEVLKPAAIEGYRLAFVVLRDVASFDCPAALEQFLACYLDLVRLEGLHGDSASDNRSLVAVSTQLTVIHQKLGRQIVTAEVRRCAETLDVWLRRYQIGERLGDKFAKAWTATCRTLQCRSEHDNHDNLD